MSSQWAHCYERPSRILESSHVRSKMKPPTSKNKLVSMLQCAQWSVLGQCSFPSLSFPIFHKMFELSVFHCCSIFCFSLNSSIEIEALNDERNRIWMCEIPAEFVMLELDSISFKSHNSIYHRALDHFDLVDLLDTEITLLIGNVSDHAFNRNGNHIERTKYYLKWWACSFFAWESWRAPFLRTFSFADIYRLLHVEWSNAFFLLIWSILFRPVFKGVQGVLSPSGEVCASDEIIQNAHELFFLKTHSRLHCIGLSISVHFWFAYSKKCTISVDRMYD